MCRGCLSSSCTKLNFKDSINCINKDSRSTLLKYILLHMILQAITKSTNNILKTKHSLSGVLLDNFIMNHVHFSKK